MNIDTPHSAADTESIIVHLLDMAQSLTHCVYQPLLPADATMLRAAAALLAQQIVVTTDYSRGIPCS